MNWNTFFAIGLGLLLPHWAQAEAHLKMGDPAPQLKPEHWVQGAPITEFKRGQVYVVEFWGTWCPPCIEAIPHLNELQAQYADQGVTFVGVAAWERGPSPEANLKLVQEFLARKNPEIQYTVAYDTENVNVAWLKAAKVAGIPATFVVDREGRLAFIGHPALLAESSVGHPLEQIVKGTWSTSEARAKYVRETEEELAVQEKLEAAFDGIMKAQKQKDWQTLERLYNEAIALNTPHSPGLLAQKARLLVEHLERAPEGLQIAASLRESFWEHDQALGILLEIVSLPQAHSHLPTDMSVWDHTAERVIDLIDNHPDAFIRAKAQKYRWILLPPVSTYYHSRGRADLAMKYQQVALDSLTAEDDRPETRAELETKLTQYQEAAGCVDGVCPLPDTMSSAEIDRRRASLLGLAYGDALGAVTENYTRQQIFQVFDQHLSLSRSLPLGKIREVRGERNLLRARIPGYTTDDTQQATALILTLLRQPDWQEDGLKAWSHFMVLGSIKKAWRGIGRMFSTAVDNLKKGVDHRQSGAASSGIGAAMRVAPVAGLATIPHSILTEAVITSSLVTHADLTAAAMSYAVFAASDLLIKGVSASEVRQLLPDLVAEMERTWQKRSDWTMAQLSPNAVSQTLRQVFQNMSTTSLSAPELSTLVVRSGEPYVEERFKRDIHPNNPFALLGGVHAVALALQDDPEPLATLQYIVNLGDDTDTVAAIAGGLLGARFGSSWIPIRELVDHERWLKYADAMISGVAPETPEEYVAHEALRTQEEQTFQARVAEACEEHFKKP